MKKSVINQVEKVLRESISVWESVKVTRDEKNDWVTFNITDEDGFMTTPVINKVIRIHDAFEITTLSLDINCCITATIREMGEAIPVLQLNIRKG